MDHTLQHRNYCEQRNIRVNQFKYLEINPSIDRYIKLKCTTTEED